MPNIQGNYSLTEIATKLNVSASWINGVQKLTGICSRDLAQGKRAEFTDQDVTILKNVKLLRLLDYSLNDIKQIYDLEKQINKIGYMGDVRPDEKCFQTIIHSNCIFSEENEKDEHLFKLLKDKSKGDVENYYKLIKELCRISKEVGRRVEDTQDITDALQNRLGTNINYAQDNEL